MQIYIFILKKPKIILKNLMKFALFLLGGRNITIKQTNKWSFKIFLYFLCTAWKNVPKRVRRQKVCSFWFGRNWKGDKQMQNKATCKVKPLQSSLLLSGSWNWCWFCYPASGWYSHILYCAVLGCFQTLWSWMVDTHFPFPKTEVCLLVPSGDFSHCSSRCSLLLFKLQFKLASWDELIAAQDIKMLLEHRNCAV